MAIVILQGRSHKGKNRVREHGESWDLEDMGVWQGKQALKLRSRDGRNDFRWVEKENDPDFIVISIDRQ